METKIVQFGEQNNLIGLLSIPEKKISDICFIFFSPGILNRTGQCRVFVKITQKLVQSGFSCLRFDLSGTGDSELANDNQNLSYQQRVERDVFSAIQYLRQQKFCSKVVLVGSCSGAYQSLTAAHKDSRDILGVVAINTSTAKSLKWILRCRILDVFRWHHILIKLPLKLLRKNSANNKGELDNLNITAEPPEYTLEKLYEKLIKSKVKLLCLCSQWDNSLEYNFQVLKKLNKKNIKGNVKTGVIPDADHDFAYVKNQVFLSDSISEWALREFVKYEPEHNSKEIPYQDFGFIKNILPRWQNT